MNETELSETEFSERELRRSSFDSLGSRKRKINRVPLPFTTPAHSAYSSLEDGFDSNSDNEDSSLMAC
ncbi:hypothetical protein IGI04_026031 [Brassica rapa subsp. trilocularis]|uniref:Uncharacterized protein n=1 Tax=Brassica rapa subsp. trilocularis TaxID=1813537 RepID=A0ABQ7KUU5_BRACM|nr:hypothetical protein IGI04_026031 [Brassica rapa subsp. trilocularis]